MLVQEDFILFKNLAILGINGIDEHHEISLLLNQYLHNLMKLVELGEKYQDEFLEVYGQGLTEKTLETVAKTVVKLKLKSHQN